MQISESKTTATQVRAKKQDNQPLFSWQDSRDTAFFSNQGGSSAPFFSPGIIQPKLNIGRPDDVYEQQADAMADQVVAKINAPAAVPAVQTKCANCAEEEKIQKKEQDPEEQLQAKGNVPGLQASADLENRLGATKGGGSLLPEGTRTSMESAFGSDFDGVRVHTGSEAVQMNQELGAQAFTHGSDVYFGEGKFSPGTKDGDRLLAHELTHTVQQGGGISNKVQKFSAKKLEDVTSLQIDHLETVELPAKSDTADDKLEQRVSRLDERKGLLKSGSVQHNSIQMLETNNAFYETLLSDISDAEDKPSLARSIVKFNLLIETEKPHMAELKKSRQNGILIAVLNEFIKSVNSLISMKNKLFAEQDEFNRFDSDFSNKDVGKLLGAVAPIVPFNAADVKSLTAQETGDFTNTAVAGISAKKTGVKTHIKNAKGAVGLGQHLETGMKDAIKWAKSHGVTIKSKPDPRTIPSESIKLTAAYIGFLSDFLNEHLPEIKPEGDDFKKFVFAAYNNGPGGIVAKTKKFVGKKPKKYSWSEVQSKAPAETRKYVDEIVERLS